MRLCLLLICLLPLACLAAEPAPHEQYGISLWSKLKYPEGFTHFDYVNPDAPKRGTVKLAAIGSFDSLNAFIVKGNKAPNIGMIFDSLMTGSIDEPQSMYGLIAKSAVVAPDGSYAEFVMRPEARFQDHTPITADDVVFSFNQLKKEGEPAWRIGFAPVDAAVKLDDHRVRFTFSDKTKRELPLLVASMPILSKAYYSSHDFTKTTLEPPLGSGPYKITAVEPGRSIVYERVKDYWGEKLPVNIGQNNFDTLRYDMYRDETVALEALKHGEYDFREENVARIWATGYDSPALTEGRLKKMLVHHEVPQGMQGFMFNVRRDKFKDRRVREAIALTLDFEWMNKSLFYSAYHRDTSYFSNTEFAAPPLPGKDELALLEPFKADLPPELFTTEFKLPVTDGSGNDRAELIRADKLLVDAGYVIRDGRRVNAKTGEPLNFEFLFQSPAYERVAFPLRKHLKQLGIDASIRMVDSAQYIKRMETFDYDVVMMSVNTGLFYPGYEQMMLWHSSIADQQGGNNYAGVKSPVVDALVAKITSAKTEADLIAAGRALDRVLLWEYYMIPHWRLNAYRVAYWDKFAWPSTPPKYSLGFMTWWLK
jgi:microcin C transport system substrate-binding protein